GRCNRAAGRSARRRWGGCRWNRVLRRPAPDRGSAAHRSAPRRYREVQRHRRPPRPFATGASRAAVPRAGAWARHLRWCYRSCRGLPGRSWAHLSLLRLDPQDAHDLLALAAAKPELRRTEEAIDDKDVLVDAAV